MRHPRDSTSSTTRAGSPIKLSVHTKDGTYARYEAGTINWTECEAIERDPDRMGGAWLFKGSGVPLANLFHALAAGLKTQEFVRSNEEVEEAGPEAVLEFVAEQLDDTKEALWGYGGPRTATPPRLDGGEHNRDAEHDPETTHWKDCGNAWRDAERMTGSWCIRHSRFPLSDLFSNLADMGNMHAFVDAFSVTMEEAVPLLQFLAEDLDRVRRHPGRGSRPTA